MMPCVMVLLSRSLRLARGRCWYLLNYHFSQVQATERQRTESMIPNRSPDLRSVKPTAYVGARWGELQWADCRL
jgi:hypothetical protein